MASKKKLLQAAASSASGGGLDVDEVFSTYLYDGTGATQNISNGINLGNNIAGSVDFDGAGDSLESTSHSFAYGTGDFTVEFWMYPHSLSSQSIVFGARADASTGFMIGPNNSGEIRFYYNNAERIVDTGNALSINTWFHIAVTRASGTTKLFKNGTQVGSSYSDTNNYTSSVLEIGQRAISDGLAYDGLVSNVRVVLGTALYTSNFTPSTEPLTAISGTELLICTSNNFEDEGPNKISFTVKGDPQSSSSSPFTGNTGEGGLVWTKVRTQTDSHYFWDTERGVNKRLSSNSAAAQQNETTALTSFNSNGFTLGTALNVNGSAADWGSAADYCSWTFRRAPKFFDVVTYTGTGSAQAIAHNLGSVPGMIITKATGIAYNWGVFHRGIGNTKALILDVANAADTGSSYWNNTDPTSTHFTVGSDNTTNDNGQTYVAYLFAHNNSDGEFGDGSQDVIKCGSYTGNGSTDGPEINLGFEPQWILQKSATKSNTDWAIADFMRGFTADGVYQRLRPNRSDGEGSETQLAPTSTGFKVVGTASDVNTNGETYIYMAIRRGPLAEPTSATDVFSPNLATGFPRYATGFVTDFTIQSTLDSGSKANYTRLTGTKAMRTTSSAAEFSSSWDWAQMTGSGPNFSSTNYIGWNWKRAPGYFDVVAYSGNGSTQNVSHNLGAVPEMMWIKSRNASEEWKVYHSAIGNNKELVLSSTAASGNTSAFNNTTPTSSVFSVGASSPVNDGAYDYIAYLFATVAGVSKVGSYTGNGSSTGPIVDCGFSSGPRFVLIKRVDNAGSWHVFDSTRGIVAGNDPYLFLNSTAVETSDEDVIDPTSSGFQLATSASAVNTNNETYIFYAIA